MRTTRRKFFGSMAAAGAGLLAAGMGRGVALARERVGALKITGVDIYPMNIPLKEPFRIALGTITHANEVLVVIKTDGGISGMGEAGPIPMITGTTQATDLAVAQGIAKIINGKDPLKIEELTDLMVDTFHGNATIRAAYDSALYDILGQAAGLPVYRLLGGNKPTFETDTTVSLDTPDVMAAKAAGWVGRGFKQIKIKLGDPAIDEDRVRAIREAVGPNIGLQVDVNQGWSVREAVDTINRIERYDMELIEQPIAASDFRGLKFVREHVGVPIMADESLVTSEDAIELVRLEAVDMFNIKLMKTGGIREGLRIAAIARAAGIPCMVGCMGETRLALTAASHLVAAEKVLVYADLDMALFLESDPVEGGIQYEGGTITLPEGPGLGAKIGDDYLKRLKKV
ncbi:mandelate racemase/muconate lactonizing enzyme family protein [candidate division KSB1 bacterium]